MADIKEPEIYEQVKNEISRLGAESEANYTELRKEWTELKSTLERGEENSEKVAKLQEAILARDEEMKKAETAVNSRLDNFEAILKRTPRTDAGENADYKSAREFYTSVKATKGGATYNNMKTLDIDIDGFNAYQKEYEDYLRRGERVQTPDQVKAMSVGVDPDGGYTVTPEMSNTIIQRLYETDPIRELANVMSISTDAVEMLVDWDQVEAGWETETATTSPTDTSQLSKKRVPVHVMRCSPRVTQQLLDDSAINIPNFLSNKIGDRMSRVEAAAFVSGDGVGKPRGFLDYGDGTTFGTIERTNMGAAAALTGDGLIDVKYSLQEWYQSTATWLMNRTTVAAAMKLKDGAGNYLWSPGLQNSAPSTLCGLPYRMSTTMPEVAANALSVAIADWREAYLVVDRLGITIQRDPYTAKPFVEFYTRKRVGGDVVNFDAIKIGVVAV